MEGAGRGRRSGRVRVDAGAGVAGGGEREAHGLGAERA